MAQAALSAPSPSRLSSLITKCPRVSFRAVAQAFRPEESASPWLCSAALCRTLPHSAALIQRCLSALPQFLASSLFWFYPVSKAKLPCSASISTITPPRPSSPKFSTRCFLISLPNTGTPLPSTPSAKRLAQPSSRRVSPWRHFWAPDPKRSSSLAAAPNPTTTPSSELSPRQAAHRRMSRQAARKKSPPRAVKSTSSPPPSNTKPCSTPAKRLRNRASPSPSCRSIVMAASILKPSAVPSALKPCSSPSCTPTTSSAPSNPSKKSAASQKRLTSTSTPTLI